MPTLAEKLAALRAGTSPKVETPYNEKAKEEVKENDGLSSADRNVQETDCDGEGNNAAPATGETTTATVSPSRELSLAEKIAALKAGKGNNSSNVPVSSNVATANKPSNNSTSLSEIGKALRKAPQLPDEINEKAPASLHSLRERIWKLQETADGMNLKDEMKKLQAALIENPAAVSYFLPEDYGEMVLNIRRMVGNAVAANLGKPASKGKKASGSVAAQSEQISLDELSF